ncbi:hypothetical protein GY21_10075 [Cryobacterium roopkundense]|uniref:YdhG-like domain-containing protein n=1 Tax=Cryobacterium roopkundense TaxID=1001240 RepID=A0A099JBI8_9MICO|nr:DUF1801 domain-containing protein [Cryobacterium roopkundense]KGJ74872.1 hypothetical protein GY21_10075 [Cryobacterium roopkundense]MBB5640627.1 hypothetical protein [Cryobacterium roopkundense]
MTNRSAEVDAFMAALDHPRAALVQQIRLAILTAEPKVTERIKWNAPSFCRDGVDRVTFNLRPADRVHLIFHRGSTARQDPAPFHFEDSTGLLVKITEERGQVTFFDADAVRAGKASLLALVHAWIRA